MAKLPKLVIGIGSDNFDIDLAKVTYGRAMELDDKVSEARRKYSIYAKYPQEPGEDREQWGERISKLAQEEFKRKEDESVEDHLRRLFKGSEENFKMTCEIVNAILTTFGHRSVTQDELKSVPFFGLHRFIADTLSSFRIACDDYIVEIPTGK